MALGSTYARRRLVVRLLLAIALGSGACGAPENSVSKPGSAAPIDPSAAARASLVIASCMDDGPAERRLEGLFQRVDAPGSTDDTRAVVDCLEAHREGCRAVEQCMAVSVSKTAEVTRCDGEVAVTDFGPRTVRVDCPRLGRRCVVAGAIAECIEITADRCAGADRPRCTPDGRPMRCRGGAVAFGPSCHALGLACLEGSAGAFCAGTDSACPFDAGTKPSMVSFDGTGCVDGELEACVGGGRAVLDCGTMIRGAGCMKKDGAHYCGLADACLPGRAAAPACDGDSVVVCNGGRIDRIDCKTLGFVSCVSRTSSLGQTYAACSESSRP